MDISTIGVSSRTNRILNSLSRKLEIVFIFLLLFGFFDMNMGTFSTTFNVISYGLLLYLVILRWKRCFYVATRDIFLIILVATILLSYFWSAAPDYTVDETKTILRSTLFGAYLAAHYHPKNLMQLLMNFFGLAIILNFVYINLMLATGQSHLAIAMTNNEPSWIGFLTHKQYLGRMAMHSAVIYLLSGLGNKNNSGLNWSIFSLSGIILFMSKSKTSWIGFLISLSLLPILKFASLQYKLRTMMYVTAVLVVGCVAVLVFGNLDTIVVDILRKPPDFNGRFDIWYSAIESGLKRPLLGYGYSGFWTSDVGLSIVRHTWAFSDIGTSTRFHSHNGFIDIFLQLGLLGFGLFLIIFFTTVGRVINLINVTKSIESFWMLQFLVLSFLLQTTETLTLLSSHTVCSVYVAIVLSTILWQDQTKKITTRYK